MNDWIQPIFHAPDSAAAWSSLFEMLGTLSQASTSPEELRKQTIAPDRLLAESAWELWQAYNATAPRTSQAIQEWWAKSVATGRATLILDAMNALAAAAAVKWSRDQRDYAVISSCHWF